MPSWSACSPGKLLWVLIHHILCNLHVHLCDVLCYGAVQLELDLYCTIQHSHLTRLFHAYSHRLEDTTRASQAAVLRTTYFKLHCCQRSHVTLYLSTIPVLFASASSTAILVCASCHQEVCCLHLLVQAGLAVHMHASAQKCLLCRDAPAVKLAYQAQQNCKLW